MPSKTPSQNQEKERAQQIGERIKIFRESKGWSQSDLAEALKRDVGTVSRWERGVFPAHMPRRLRELAESTGVSGRWLMTGEGAMVGEIKRLGASENVVPYQAPPPTLDQALMESAMLAVLQLLEARNLKLSPERTVAGVMAVYEAARAQGKGSVTDADVTPLVRLLMA